VQVGMANAHTVDCTIPDVTRTLLLFSLRKILRKRCVPLLALIYNGPLPAMLTAGHYFSLLDFFCVFFSPLNLHGHSVDRHPTLLFV